MYKSWSFSKASVVSNRSCYCGMESSFSDSCISNINGPPIDHMRMVWKYREDEKTPFYIIMDFLRCSGQLCGKCLSFSACSSNSFPGVLEKTESSNCLWLGFDRLGRRGGLYYLPQLKKKRADNQEIHNPSWVITFCSVTEVRLTYKAFLYLSLQEISSSIKM